MKSHVQSSSIELWTMIENGLRVVDRSNMTRREVVDSQLDATAKHMIQLGVGAKDMPHIQHLNTAKECWDTLTDIFIGNESMRRNRYEALSNQAEGFYMLDGEDHEDMYRRLKSVATTFRDHGATYVDDAWIKRKYVSALMPFEAIDLKSLQGRYNYHLMTSNEVMQEMAAFKVAAKNAEDARARAIGMHKGVSLALKAKVVEEEDEKFEVEPSSMRSPEEVKFAYHDFMALQASTFWKDPIKAKAMTDQRNFNGGRRSSGPRTRVCYNCGDQYHFVAECKYQRREDNNGNLVLKDKSKTTKKKPFVKKKYPNKRPTKIVLLTKEEEYTSGEEEEDEEDDTSSEVAAIATTSTTPSSLFDSPNENLPKTAQCLMAKANEVPSSISSKHALNYDDMDDAISLKIKEEIVAFEYFLANLQGESKKHFGALMCQLGEANERLELIGKSERNAANKIADLENELEEEQEARAALEEQLETLEESQNESYSQIIKERDLARAKLKKLKKKQVEFEADHTRLKEDKERLEEAHKALERENSSLGESYELLQTQLAKYEMPSSSNPSCDHANIIEENARLKDELAKVSIAQCEDALDTLEGIQKQRNGKQGLGYQAKKKNKKNKKKKAKVAQAKKDQGVGGNASKGKATHDNFAGITNPNYILYCDYYGDVYAKYVGPMDGYIDWCIWVPKTLVANKRGPLRNGYLKPRLDSCRTMLPVGQNGCLIVDAQVI